MSPTVFRAGGLRFYFFSREESRLHIHVSGHAGEAKFWIEPRIEPARNFGLAEAELTAAWKLIEEHENDIRKAWRRHFCIFRAKVATDSDAKLPLIPNQTCQSFRRKVATHSEPNLPV